MQFLNRELVETAAQIAATSRGGCRRLCRCCSTLQAMRASLLARAVASLFLCNRSAAALSHAPKLKRSQLCGRISRTFAAWIKSVRRYLLAALGDAAEDRSGRPCCIVAGPGRARRQSRARVRRLRRRRWLRPWRSRSSVRCQARSSAAGSSPRRLAISSISPVMRLDPLVEPEPVLIEADDQIGHARRYLVLAGSSDISKSELRRARGPALTAMPCSIRKARI